MTLFGGIEAGGTKFVCAVGKDPDDICMESFETGSPHETLSIAISFFEDQLAIHKNLNGIGIASFGPVDLHRHSPTYGHILKTPKPGWSHFNIVKAINERIDIPIYFDTDVNAAALAENLWGAAKGLHTFIYLTVGTGIGGGAMVNGTMLHGLLHPEMGHIILPRSKDELSSFQGVCPFHRDCLEGLASGPAIAQRWGKAGSDLPPGHRAWALEAEYLATALVDYICVVSPQRIILGGGVMQQKQLFDKIHHKVLEKLNGYIDRSEIVNNIADYIVPPDLESKAGVLGAIALARKGTCSENIKQQ
jgi:fructokinase